MLTKLLKCCSLAGLVVVGLIGSVASNEEMDDIVTTTDGVDLGGVDDELRLNDGTVVVSKKMIVSKLSDRIRNIVEHYQQEDPVGLPEMSIPDPFSVPRTERGAMTFDNMNICGLSQFRIVKVHTDLSAMEITMGILLSKLEILGNYTLKEWWNRSQGPFNVTLVNVYIEGKASVIVNIHGKLEADHVDLDGKVEDIKLDFQNLSVIGSVLQGILNTAGTFLFDTIKPQMLQEFNVKLLQTMNDNLKSLNHTFQHREIPIDSMIRSVRQLIRDRNIDPYRLEINNFILNNTIFSIDEFVLYGLSRFYRIGDISIHMENRTLQLSVHIGIPLVRGRTQWHLNYIKTSQTCFQIKYIQIHISINQTVNKLNESPRINFINIEIGQIKLIKYTNQKSIMENIVYNYFPNILRVQLLNIVKKPLSNYIQDNVLNQIKLKEYISQIVNK